MSVDFILSIGFTEEFALGCAGTVYRFAGYHDLAVFSIVVLFF